METSGMSIFLLLPGSVTWSKVSIWDTG
jgi:hypothetical protein